MNLKPEEIIYQLGVKAHFKENSIETFSNGKALNASFIYEEFFLNAKKQVCFFCKNLCQLVFNRDELILAAQKAVDNGIELKFAITENVIESENFKNFLKRNDITVKKVAPLKSNDKYINFAFMDDKAYRFEKDATQAKAVASANDKEITKLLQDTYSNLSPISI